MPFDPSSAVLEEEAPVQFDPASAKEETPAFDLSSATIEELTTPSLRAQALAPGETVPTVSRGTPLPVAQAFPARERALADFRRPRPIPETPAPTEEQQKAMLTGVAQPESEIHPIGKPGTLLRGASSVVAGILNRPEYLAALANPATATAVGLRFAPQVATQFLEDLGKATQGDNEALGRAAIIGIPALIGGVRAGRTITERLNAQTALERVKGASSAAHVDALARLELAPKSEPTAPSLLPLSEAAVEQQTKGEPSASGAKPFPVTTPGAESVGFAIPIQESLSAGLTDARSFLSPPDLTEPIVQTKPTSGSLNRGVWLPEPLSDLVESHPIVDERTQTLDIEGIRHVLPMMIRSLEDDQVFNSVISTIPVDVVNMLASEKFSPEELLHDKSMFVSALRLNPSVAARLFSFFSSIHNPEIAELYASAIRKSKEIHGDVSIQPLEGTGQVSINEGGDGIQPQAQGRLPEEAVTPETLPSETRAGTEVAAGAETTPTPSPAGQVETPGETPQVTPTQAAAKVESQIQEVARTEGTRPAKDIKSELVKKIEEAIDAAPPESEVKASSYTTSDMKRHETPDRAEMVEINIPGDGNFKIRNTKEALGEILKRAQRISTKSTEGPSISRSGISKEDKAAVAQTLTERQPKSEPSPDISVGPGAASPVDITRPGTVVSNMFAAIDADRAALGKPPMEPGEPRTWEQDRQAAMARMNHDPQWIPDLIKEVLEKPRPLRSDEHAGMVLQKAYWKAEANNALRRISQSFDDGRTDDLVQAKADAARFEDNLQQMEEAVGRGGTGSEAGRTLQAQKMGLTDDLSLVEMRLEMRGKVGGRKLTEEEGAAIEKLHKEYEAKLAAVEKTATESERRRVEAETRATVAELARQAEKPKASSYVIATAEKWVKQWGEEAKGARERLAGKFLSPSPADLLDLAKIVRFRIGELGLDVARITTELVRDFGEGVRPYIANAIETAKGLIDQYGEGLPKATRKAVAETIKKGDSPEQKIGKLTERIKERATNNKRQPLAPAIQALARSLIERGIRGRDELVNAVHRIIAPIIPDWDLYKTKQAISGYGDYRTLSKDEISVQLRDIKGQLQQMLKLEDIAFGKAPLRSGVEQREVTKAQQDLVKLVNEAKRKGGYETTDPATQLRTALDEAKKRSQTAIDEYERRIREKDYSVRKLSPIKPDDELTNKQAELKRVRKQWEQMKRDKELADRAGWRKALDKFVRWERAFKLSSPVVFGKLGAAALTRVATTAAEEVAGAGLGLVPGIRQAARQAPREGGINVPAMAKAMASAITKGMADAAQTARKGAADIDVVYGEKLVDKDWANFFGQLHGMMKAPVKRFEFELSLAKRIKSNMAHGVDVTDNLVMTRLMTEALNDGYRSIFMQRGFSSDMFNTTVGLMEKSKKYPVAGEITARTLRFLLPVVRVPANIVAETATGIYGAPLASARTMTAAVRGTLGNLDPVVADSIMRQWKKGSIGLGLMAIGYFNPQIFGGLDWREKRPLGAAKTAGIQIGGVDIPRWATHAPWFELMQIGATVRHVKDQHVAKTGETKGIPEGLWAAGLGLIEETPFVNEMLHADKLFDPARRDQFLGEMARGTLVPQMIQQAAALTDRPDAQRKPRNIVEHVEIGIPGLRQNVPPKTAPKSPAALYP